jgi:hypothetical protein
MVRTSTLPAMLALVFAVLIAGPLATPAEAQEDKAFDLPRASVVAEVQPDGSVLVTENITYDFAGSFEGGYREIPLKDGMRVEDVSVSEGGMEYAPGASTRLGSSGAPGTYGSADLGYAYMIVWQLQGLRRSAHVHLTLPPRGPGRGPRRRGRRILATLGRRVAGAPWLARCDHGSPRRRQQGRGQGLRAPRLGERRDESRP